LAQGVDNLGGNGRFKERLSASFADKRIDPSIPDKATVTRFSDHLLSDGGVPLADFLPNPGHCGFVLDVCYPLYARVYVGSRVALGGFSQ